MGSLLAVCFLGLVWQLLSASVSPEESQVTTSVPCVDKAPACAGYDEATCNDPKNKQWFKENCALTCNMCGTETTTASSTTIATTIFTKEDAAPSKTTPTPATPLCQDKSDTCANMDQSICTNAGLAAWVKKNCAFTCNLCGVALHASTTIASDHSTSSITPSLATKEITTKQAAAPHRCIDTVNNCGDYPKEDCKDPKYHKWALTHCPKTCDRCGELEINSLSGCHYKGKVYSQGEQFKDGCNFFCTCTNAALGEVSCQTMCLNWPPIPDVCFFDPPPPGNCCRVLECPVYIQINYPDGYAPR